MHASNRLIRQKAYPDLVHLLIQRPHFISVLVEYGLLQLLVLKQNLGHDKCSLFDYSVIRVYLHIKLLQPYGSQPTILQRKSATKFR